jgi:hypothetical protein
MSSGLQNMGYGSSNASPHTNLLIMNGHFKSLSQFNAAPVPAVLSTDIPTQMEPSFVSEKAKFSNKNTIMYCPEKPVKEFVSPPPKVGWVRPKRGCLLFLLAYYTFP